MQALALAAKQHTGARDTLIAAVSLSYGAFTCPLNVALAQYYTIDKFWNTTSE